MSSQVDPAASAAKPGASTSRSRTGCSSFLSFAIRRHPPGPCWTSPGRSTPDRSSRPWHDGVGRSGRRRGGVRRELRGPGACRRWHGCGARGRGGATGGRDHVATSSPNANCRQPPNRPVPIPALVGVFDISKALNSYPIKPLTNRRRNYFQDALLQAERLLGRPPSALDRSSRSTAAEASRPTPSGPGITVTRDGRGAAGRSRPLSGGVRGRRERVSSAVGRGGTASIGSVHWLLRLPGHSRAV